LWVLRKAPPRSGRSWITVLQYRPRMMEREAAAGPYWFLI
jgi:hypothetical protein